MSNEFFPSLNLHFILYVLASEQFESIHNLIVVYIEIVHTVNLCVYFVPDCEDQIHATTHCSSIREYCDGRSNVGIRNIYNSMKISKLGNATPTKYVTPSCQLEVDNNCDDSKKKQNIQ